MGRGVALFLAAFLVVSGVFVLAPGIDLWATGLFYRPGAGFFLSQWAPFRLIYRGIPYLVDAIALGVPALFMVSVFRRRPFLGVDRRVAAFLLLSLLLGPGLVVNAVFKDHWGRARPTQTVEFGGDKPFTPAFVPSNACQHNCSFPAGHPAIGFYAVSFAFLLRDRRRRRLATGAALVFGAIVGVARLAQGGHFLSDVVLSGFFVYATSWLLHRWVVERDGLATLGRQMRHPPPTALRVALLGLATAVAILLSVAFIDRPLALYLHASDATLRHVFSVVTELGISTGYLVLSAALYLAFRTAAARAASPATAMRLAGYAWRAGFVFAAVAASGLLADLLKPIFGRMRPKLLFADQLYGFTWSGAHATYWSFPSGHSVTIAAVATAFALLWPRGLPVYLLVALLVMASRVIIGAHYLADVLAGGYLGLVVTLGLWAAALRTGGARRVAQTPPAAAPPLSDSP